jgi:hypothetical protein
VQRIKSKYNDNKYDNYAQATIYGFREDGWKTYIMGYYKLQKEVEL